MYEAVCGVCVCVFFVAEIIKKERDTKNRFKCCTNEYMCKLVSFAHNSLSLVLSLQLLLD